MVGTQLVNSGAISYRHLHVVCKLIQLDFIDLVQVAYLSERLGIASIYRRVLAFRALKLYLCIIFSVWGVLSSPKVIANIILDAKILFIVIPALYPANISTNVDDFDFLMRLQEDGDTWS